MIVQEPASDEEEENDDFEVVPQYHANDADMWDAENENEDEVKEAKIKSK
jgi:AdoMet-dependent rRNA methyltransferase SPB1